MTPQQMALRFLLPVAIVAAVAATYEPVVGFAFLNWDDHNVIVGNASLAFPGVWTWAFTTTFMEHYQPVSWLVWAATKAAFGVDPRAFHAVNVVAHVVATLLVFVTARQFVPRALPKASPAWRDGAAVIAALLFGLHPLRVEVVAWVSAMPYALALALALAAVLTWQRASAGKTPRSLLPSLAFYILSLLARPAALGLPVVFVLLDVWLHGRTLARSVRRAAPFGVLALAAAVAEAAARAPRFADVSWLYRLQLAATAPFVYVWRTLAPVRLTPLDVLPLAPEPSVAIVLVALAALAGLSAAAWHWRREWPGLGVAWVASLALLGPAAGLVPSGLQATADRYAYFPGVVIALGVVGAGTGLAARQLWRTSAATAAAALLVLSLAIGARTTLELWSDSISLWTHVVTVDPANDVGLYNLGTALTAAGRQSEAATRYREALAVNPTHAEARANLNRLDAARLEQEGNDLAARGDLQQASERYDQALALDAMRTHSHAALGVALATLGRFAEARPHLEEARRQGNTEPAVANALGVMLAQAGRPREARTVFESALSVNQNDVSLALNLVQVLLSSEPGDGGDRALALRLATAVVEATGGRDARIVETLAAALAVNGRMAEARTTNARAAALARAQGNEALAVQITTRGRAYRNPGP